MTARRFIHSIDHASLLQSLVDTDALLIIQDLDGVCMDLVRDPLTRRIDRRYVEATRMLAGQFYVLTNGEHIGSRGVNAVVEQAFDTPDQVRDQGFYLPGLAAGGVQLQDRHGQVSHPGVSDEELAFLATVPRRAEQFLEALLGEPPFALEQTEIRALLAAVVLDNPASPTLNLNALHHRFGDRPGVYAQLQRAAASFMAELQRRATAAGLADSFFTHLAPNLGRDAQGEERLKTAQGDDSGTTDFQFMLKGAIKEVGVLVILNHYYYLRTGAYPLGEQFNARQSPRAPEALLQLAHQHFDPDLMPRIVGVGDTVTAQTQDEPGSMRWLRGGSDRGFLTLVQRIGERFDRDNVVVFIDSSRGEVRRAGVDAARLQRMPGDPQGPVWDALRGISDAQDPLMLNAIFPGGHAQYVDFFCRLAAQRAARGV